MTAAADHPSTGKFTLCAIAIGALWGVLAADGRSVCSEREHQADGELVDQLRRRPPA